MEITEKTYCRWCGRNLTNDEHHIFRRSDIPELINNQSNKVLLCRNCHDLATQFRPVEQLFQWAFFGREDGKVSVGYVQERMRDLSRPITPKEIVDFRRYLAAEYSFITAQLDEIDKNYPRQWNALRNTTTSDRQADKLYDESPEGIERKSYQYQSKGIEKLLSSLRSMLDLAIKDGFNAYLG